MRNTRPAVGTLWRLEDLCSLAVPNLHFPEGAANARRRLQCCPRKARARPVVARRRRAHHAQCRDRQAMTVAGFDWPFLVMERGMMSPDAAQPHQPLASTNAGLRLH